MQVVQLCLCISGTSVCVCWCRGMHVWVQGYACTDARVLLGMWCVCVCVCMVLHAYGADDGFV